MGNLHSMRISLSLCGLSCYVQAVPPPSKHQGERREADEKKKYVNVLPKTNTQNHTAAPSRSEPHFVFSVVPLCNRNLPTLIPGRR
ncbi:hypothetical protein F5B20DRAFT_21321 [Whalleya microplaca]|nr:hypothetical protein F5B20DRAFT_21321 [Whalleya microplaca]